jgi:hypothetical protein
MRTGGDLSAARFLARIFIRMDKNFGVARALFGMNPRFRRLNISSRLYLRAETYRKNTEEDAFEAAFAGFQTQPTASRTYAPSKPLTPWYLDPTSGGPNPEVRKPGIAYGEDGA